MLLTPFGSLLNLTLLNSVGNQKALVGKTCLFATNAFWFPTEFDIVKFSREPKGFSREPTEFDIVKFSREPKGFSRDNFPTKAFWFPTEFNNVKFSREPKGVGRENMLICY